MDLEFVKPRRCDNSSPNCVEVAKDGQGNRFVRNSQQPDGAVVQFTSQEWEAFTVSVREGQQF